MIKGTHICWECLARSKGYDSAKQMLAQMYTVERMTTRRMGQSLGFAHGQINERLRFYSVPLRAKGRQKL